MQRADYDPSYFRRFLWVTLACLVYTGWCCYDAFIAYPAKRVIAAEYDQLREEYAEAEKSKSELASAWRELASEKGYSTKPPEKTAKEVGEAIGTQFFMMVLCGIVGIPAFMKWCSGHGTWIEGDEELLRNSKGKEVQIANITKIDKRKWEDKGIAYIHHTVDGKRQKKFVMDDFKFHRETMGQLMLNAEANLTPEQIVGGKSEREMLSEKEEAERKKAERAQERAESIADVERGTSNNSDV